MEIEPKKIFCGPSKILKNILWPISIRLKYFMTPTTPTVVPPYTLNVWSLEENARWQKTCNFCEHLHLPGLQRTIRDNHM